MQIANLPQARLTHLLEWGRHTYPSSEESTVLETESVQAVGRILETWLHLTQATAFLTTPAPTPPSFNVSRPPMESAQDPEKNMQMWCMEHALQQVLYDQDVDEVPRRLLHPLMRFAHVLSLQRQRMSCSPSPVQGRGQGEDSL